jgi:hypothetical protein
MDANRYQHSPANLNTLGYAGSHRNTDRNLYPNSITAAGSNSILQEFSVILLVGLLSGTYSSIFIAAPLLVVWETGEWKTWFGRKPSAA